MRIRLCLAALIFYAASFLCCSVHGQVSAPISGEITVRLIEGLDSATSQPGTASHAIVTKSTNPSVSKNAQAVVQLGVDPSTGTLSAQLVQITVAGKNLKTASSKAVLSGGLIPGLNGALNKADKTGNKTVLAGPHVFIPANTVVQFTLADLGTQAAVSAQQAKQQAPEVTSPSGPNVWKPVTIPESTESMAGNGMTIEGAASSGAKRGRVHLQVSCYTKGYNATSISVSPALFGRTPDDYGEAEENHATVAHFKIGDTASQDVSFSVDKKLNSTSLILGLSLPDEFYTARYAGQAVAVSFLSPDGKAVVLDASFTLPIDAGPMTALTAPCIERAKQALAESARQMAEQKAKIVVSCPATKAGKPLDNMRVKVLPSGRIMQGDTSDGAYMEWALDLKKGEHGVLECNYAPPGKGSAATRISLPIPANAVSCESTTDDTGPVGASCSRK